MIYSEILRFIYWIHNLSKKIYSIWKWAPEVTKEVTLKGLIDKVQQVYQISVTLLRETLTQRYEQLDTNHVSTWE